MKRRTRPPFIRFPFAHFPEYLFADGPSCDLDTKQERRAGWTYQAAHEPRRFEPYR